MRTPTREFIEAMRQMYPKGSRITLNHMDDPYHPVEPGTTGTLDHIDDMATFHVTWDNGRTLGVVYGVDSFNIEAPKPTTMKLYMPLTAHRYERDEWGYLEDDETPLSDREILNEENAIVTALVRNRKPEESERGIMHWYDEKDSVNDKVKSVVFTAEPVQGKLWGVAECRVIGNLTPTELETLKEYITGQASDGWGEGFEQREIPTEDGDMYVHLCNGDNWYIKTEEECFAPKLAEGLPDICFSTLPTTGELICIKKGESGYYRSDWSTDDPERNAELADYNNERLGVTSEQRQAMECGSMHGWECPGADPSTYEREQTMGGMTLG